MAASVLRSLGQILAVTVARPHKLVLQFRPSAAVACCSPLGQSTTSDLIGPFGRETNWGWERG